MKRHAIIAVLLAVVLSVANTALAQWSIPKGIPGFGSRAATGKSPSAYLVIATVAFLQGGQTLMEATGHAKEATKYASLIKDLNGSNSIDGESLGQVRERGEEMTKVANDQQQLNRADQAKVTEAAVKVGVGTYFEKLAIDASRNAASGGLASVAYITEAPLFVTLVPANLKTMLSVQSALFSYLKAKGINPSVNVQREIDKLQPK